MATIRVHTTQNVTLEYEVGSIGDRIVATILDNLIILAWAAFIFVVLNKLFGLDGDILAWVAGTLVVLPYVFYHLVCEIFFNGQSLGKKARDLRVIRLDGTSPRLGDYFLRWLLRIVDFGIGYGLIAVITLAINGKGQRVGDLAAGTTVISLKPRSNSLQQVVSPLLPTGYQPVFPQAADLTDQDIALVRQLLSRSLQHENYLMLNETANKIKQLLHLESSLSDEAFLRTILRDHGHLAAAE